MSKNVFINCPFDSDYSSLLRPLLFVLMYFNFIPRMADEDTDSGRNRLEKIIELIKDSSICIHDLSRCKSSESEEYFRMNMPFELGVDFGEGLSRNPKRKLLIFESERHATKKFLSDCSGFDVLCHENEAGKLVEKIRHWLVTNEFSEKTGVPSGSKLWALYTEECWVYVYECLKKQGYKDSETDSLPLNEFKGLVKKFLKK